MADPSDLQQENAPLADRLGWLGRLDAAIYQIETVIVVMALVIMSVIVFTDVVYQITLGFQQQLSGGDAGTWAMVVGIVGFVGLMIFAATNPRSAALSTDTTDDLPEPRPLALRLGLTAVLLAAFVAASVSLLYVESSTVYRVLTVLLAIPVGMLFWRRGERARLGVFVAAVLLSVWWMGDLPEGYSWAQAYGLFLLLWVGFLGGSMAARHRSHLRVDLMRKLMPPKYLPHFNAVSYLVAAAFTASIFYLGYLYLFGPDSSYLVPIWDPPQWLPAGLQENLKTFPLPEDAGVFDRVLHVLFKPTEPGAVPDWLKVLAIPVSMLLIVFRFVGHAVVFIGLAARGEEFEETMGVH